MQQVKWIMTFRNALYRGEYTGEEIRRIMEWLVNVKEDGSNPIRHRNQMPVTSGMEYTLKAGENGSYTLTDLRVNGEALDENRTYSVTMLGDNNFIIADYFCNCPMPQELNEKMEGTKENVGAHLVAALTGGKQLEAPTEYLTIQR